MTHSTGIPRGKKEMPDARWSDKIWQKSRFELHDPTYFRYSYRTGGEGERAWFEVIAEGDMNGDGKTSKLVRRGEFRGGEVRGQPLMVVDEFE